MRVVKPFVVSFSGVLALWKALVPPRDGLLPAEGERSSLEPHRSRHTAPLPLVPAARGGLPISGPIHYVHLRYRAGEW